jgi:DNA modification methylase
MIEVSLADSVNWIQRGYPWNFPFEGEVDHIITDYPYGSIFHLELYKKICSGNIITFCASEDHPFDPTERAYWIKTPSTKNYSKKLGRFVEKIFVYRQGETFNKLHWSQMTGVYDDRVILADGHQYRKPLSLIERLVRIYTNPGDLVLDPFCGEGTILRACQNLGRNAIGIDVDPNWVEHCKKEFLNAER